jgi:hypothetical protein
MEETIPAFAWQDRKFTKNIQTGYLVPEEIFETNMSPIRTYSVTAT